MTRTDGQCSSIEKEAAVTLAHTLGKQSQLEVDHKPVPALHSKHQLLYVLHFGLYMIHEVPVLMDLSMNKSVK